MAGLNTDEPLLRVGLALQKYRLHKPDADIPAPRYVIMGLQSAGKTRLLSTLARTKIGGAEKANCGTRCPVEYTFEPSEVGSRPQFHFGRSVSNLTSGSASDVAAFVTEHMDGLGEEEKRGRQGFSEEPIFVQVKSPNATPLVVADCPGLQGPEESANNACITAIYRSQLAAFCSTAIIVSALPSNLDIQQITKELRDFVRRTDLRKEHYSGALLLVNRLDAVKTSLRGTDVPLVEFQKQANERYGLVNDRMAFMCLVPEVLGTEHSIPILKDTAPVEEQNHYFAEQMWKLEEDAMRHFAKVHLGQERPARNVGVHACIDLIHGDLKDKMMFGWNRMLRSLYTEWTDTLEPQLCSMLRSTKEEVDNGELKEELDYYLGIVCEGLAGLQADDLARRLEGSVERNGKLVVKVHEAAQRHADRAGKTFLMECEEQTKLEGNDALDEVLLHTDTRCALEGAKGHPLADAMHFLHFGEAALRRLVMMQRFSWMKEPLKEFSVEKICNMGGFMDGEDVRGPSLSAIVRKAVADCKAASVKDISCFMKMVERGLVSQVHHVKSILRESVPMLQEAPKLREFIDEECVERHYVHLVGKCCQEAEKKMQNLIQARFSSLSLDEPLNLVRVLMCSGFDLFMLDPPSRFRDVTQNGGREPMAEEEIKAVLGRFAGLGLPGEVQQLAETFTSTLLRCSGNAEADEVFFKAIVAAGDALRTEWDEDPALTLALNDRLNVTNIPLKEVKAQQAKINSTIHAFVRFCRGMALMDVQMVLEKDVIIEARQLRNSMTFHMKEISDHLFFSPESQELLQRLKDSQGPPLKESRALKERLTAYLDTLMRVLEVPDMSEQQLESVCRDLPPRLQHLEEYVAAKEREEENCNDAEAQRHIEERLKTGFFDRLARRKSKRTPGMGDGTADAQKQDYAAVKLLHLQRERTKELERKLSDADRSLEQLRNAAATSHGGGGPGCSTAAVETEAYLRRRLQEAEQRIASLQGKLDSKGGKLVTSSRSRSPRRTSWFGKS